MRDAAAIDALFEFGSEHVPKVSTDAVAVGRGICGELKMHVSRPICRRTGPRGGMVDNDNLNFESNHIRT